MPTSVFQISQLVKRKSAEAQRALLRFLQSQFPQLNIETARIKPSKLSLNSINGTATARGGVRYFFKFHAEEDEELSLKQGDYYNSALLSTTGVPVLTPLAESRTPGAQCAIYEFIDAPTAFNLFDAQDWNFSARGEYTPARKKLLSWVKRLTEKQMRAYEKTLALSPSEELERSALNQLYFTRLHSRLPAYYGNIVFGGLSNLRWIINGIEYDATLAQCIARAKRFLNPRRTPFTASVIGHGDDHFGNMFFLKNDFSLFDCAFAGRQSALLSFVKATAHNVFLHPWWFYEPRILGNALKLSWRIEENKIVVEHNWNLEKRSPIRLEILAIYRDVLWRPMLQLLSDRKMLPSDWREILASALFCCPFLCLNIMDQKLFTPAASLLALSKCIELGSPTQEFITGIASALPAPTILASTATRAPTII